VKLSPPETGTGVVLLVVVPLPSWPYEFTPQQYATPLVVTPQVLAHPALIEAKTSPPETAIGFRLHGSGLPFNGSVQVSVDEAPSCPLPLSPQQ
jgi:hypothetical protein